MIHTEALNLHVDGFGRLVATLPDGTTRAGLVPVRCFPLADPERWVSLCDAEGREAMLLEDPSALDSESRRVLLDELARREFVPKIGRIVRIAGDAEPTLWEVETDRGPVSFTLPTEDHIRPLRPHGALVADSHGVRYRVEDRRKLDAHSRRLLEQYM